MHKWTHRRSFLATLFFPVLSIYVLPVSAGAQCADGSLPPCRSASPPAAPASPSTVPANKCSIIVSVQKDGQPVPGVAVALSNSNFSGGTNEVGNYQFSGLICKRNYRITLSNPNLDFTPSSKVVG
ncbi:MAG TPA: hypothetical protein VJ302_28815, partial [Blastocatellia bacterium]|nr:hypothetical protein [Blastocatellia bacterium]